MKKIALASMLLVLSVGLSGQQPDLKGFLVRLEGTWVGQGDGLSGVSDVSQEYRFILNGQFLRMATKSVFKPQEKNPDGEVHEDLGIFSIDGSRKTIVLRGFYAEGFVNTYVLDSISEDGGTYSFQTESVENGPPGTKAKLLFKFIDENVLEQSFHVAFPGREMSCFSTNIMKKK